MTGQTLTLTARGIVTFTDENGGTGTVPELVQRLRRAGAAPDDVQAVLLLAGAVKSQARLLRRIDVLEPLARSHANFVAGREIGHMFRGIGQAKQAEVRRLAKQRGLKLKGRALWNHIADLIDVKWTQVRQVLDPPKRKAPRKKPKPKQRKPR